MATGIPGPITDEICELAYTYKIYLALGLLEKAQGILYDSAILIDDRGNISILLIHPLDE